MNDWKELIREGIPDAFKRSAILQYFGIQVMQADLSYKAAKKMAGEDMLRVCE